MLKTIWGWIKKPFVWYWKTATLRTKLVIAGIFLILFAVFWIYGSCKKGSRLDEQEIQDAQNAMRDKEYEKAKEILANADIKEKVIAGEVSNAAANTEAVKQEAKKKYANMNAAELQAEFNK